MLEIDRRSCRACLAAVEANLAELRGTPAWFQLIGAERRVQVLEFTAWIRACEHELESVQLGIDLDGAAVQRAADLARVARIAPRAPGRPGA